MSILFHFGYIYCLLQGISVQALSSTLSTDTVVPVNETLAINTTQSSVQTATLSETSVSIEHDITTESTAIMTSSENSTEIPTTAIENTKNATTISTTSLVNSTNTELTITTTESTTSEPTTIKTGITSIESTTTTSGSTTTEPTTPSTTTTESTSTDPTTIKTGITTTEPTTTTTGSTTAEPTTTTTGSTTTESTTFTAGGTTTEPTTPSTTTESTTTEPTIITTESTATEPPTTSTTTESTTTEPTTITTESSSIELTATTESTTSEPTTTTSTTTDSTATEPTTTTTESTTTEQTTITTTESITTEPTTITPESTTIEPTAITTESTTLGPTSTTSTTTESTTTEPSTITTESSSIELTATTESTTSEPTTTTSTTTESTATDPTPTTTESTTTEQTTITTTESITTEPTTITTESTTTEPTAITTDSTTSEPTTTTSTTTDSTTTEPTTFTTECKTTEPIAMTTESTTSEPTIMMTESTTSEPTTATLPTTECTTSELTTTTLPTTDSTTISPPTTTKSTTTEQTTITTTESTTTEPTAVTTESTTSKTTTTITLTTTESTTTEPTTIPTESTSTDRTTTESTSTQTTTTQITTTQPLSTATTDGVLAVAIDSSPIVEGETGWIACSYISHRNTSTNNPHFKWTKNGLITSNSNSLVIYSTCHLNLFCVSTLNFTNVNILTKGQYTCNAEDRVIGIVYKGQRTTQIIVKQKPILVIKPIRSSVEEENNFTVNCYVTNTKDAFISNGMDIKMCFKNLTVIPEPICEMKSNYSYTCNFVAISNVTIKCGLGTNCSNESTFLSSVITVLKNGEKLCQNANDWPATQAGHETIIPCPDGYLGEKTRKCLSSGSWDNNINTDDCKKAELEKIENLLNYTTELTENALESSLSTISSIINNSITSSNDHDVAHNDIIQSVDLISTISDKTVNFTNQDSATKTTQVFMGVVSNILDTGKDKVTANNKAKEKEVTSKILSSVNKFAKSVTKALQVNQSVTVNKTNMILSIAKIAKTTDIKFPKKTDDNSQQLTSHFILPSEAFKNIAGDDVAFTAVKYDNIGSEFLSENGTSIGSSVLSLTVDGWTSSNHSGNITLSFQRKNDSNRNSSPGCVFLSEDQNNLVSVWNTSGCSMKNFSKTHVTCTCNHLTNFAILMSLSKTPNSLSQRLTLITYIGCSFSILGGFATIVIYLYFWRYLKNRRSVLIINLCLALSIAYLLFLTVVDLTNDTVGCSVIAALLQYFFLAMFCIMLALGIDLAVAVLDVFSSRSSSGLLLLLGWGLPAAIVGITLLSTNVGGFGDETYCWLRNDTLFGFIGPALAIIMVNFIILIIVMKTMFSSSFMLKKTVKEKTISGLRGMCALLPTLGLTWVFGVLSLGGAAVVFQYLFAIFNSLQGLFIFIFHVLLNSQVRQAVSRKVKKYESRTLTTKSSKSKFVSKSTSKEMQSFEDSNEGFRNESTGFVIPRINSSNVGQHGPFNSS